MDAPPHDLAAEQAVLGSMLQSAAAAESCRQALSPGDFYRPQHGVIFSAITALMTENIPVDTLTLFHRLRKDGLLAGKLDGAYLHTLLESVPVAASAPHYARIVRDKAVRRRLIEAGNRVIQLGQESEDDGYGAAERALREVEAVRDSGLGDGLTIRTYREFLDTSEDPYDWVIPGLLERCDRLILTGTPGLGKSTLFRQVAVCAAAGIHPFNHKPITPQRVLLLDCENGSAHVRRKLRPLIHQASATGHEIPEQNLWIESRPEGMDLARDKDLSWMLRQVAAVNPDIFALGPLYKLAPRALQTDDEAAPILAALDLARARGACILLEAHAGHGSEMRPRGSSALMGWPEFGYGLRWSQDPGAQAVRTVDVVHWRGDRDERNWPPALVAGGVWPWSEYVTLGGQAQW